jgi:hypothetical protein
MTRLLPDGRGGSATEIFDSEGAEPCVLQVSEMRQARMVARKEIAHAI